MAKVLVHVNNLETWETNENLQERYRRFLPRVFVTRKLDADRGGLDRASFWECEDTETDALIRDLTRLNPGKEVRVYTMVSESVRPAGELVTKQVTADGILPT